MTVGLPSNTAKETLNSWFPSVESFIHNVNEVSGMLPSAAPVISPVSESMLSPEGRPAEMSQLSRCSSQYEVPWSQVAPMALSPITPKRVLPSLATRLAPFIV